MNLQACQLYRKAGNFLTAARLLFDVAAAESKDNFQFYEMRSFTTVRQ